MSIWICLGVLSAMAVCIIVNQMVVAAKMKNTEEKIDQCNARCEVLRDKQKVDMDHLHERLVSLSIEMNDYFGKAEEEEDDELYDILQDIEDAMEALDNEMTENERVDNAYGEALKSFSAKIDEIQETLDKVLKDISEMKR